jgi:hypothetical protein
MSADNWTNFLISFASNLLAGLLYAIPTGVIVGWEVTRWIEKNRCKREFSAFKGRLRARLSWPNDHPPDNVRSLTPAGANAVAALLEYNAVDPWREYHPEQAPFFALLDKFEQSHGEFVLTATRLDNQIKALVFHEFARRGGPLPLPTTVISTYLNYLRSYLEAPRDAASPLGFPCHVEKLPDLSTNEFTPVVKQLLENPELAQLAEELRAKMGPLTCAIEELRTAPGIRQTPTVEHGVRSA